MHRSNNIYLCVGVLASVLTILSGSIFEKLFKILILHLYL